VKASHHGSEVPQLTEPSKKPTPQSVFSFTSEEITLTKEGSQANPPDLKLMKLVIQ